jgi:hypothetical protein
MRKRAEPVLKLVCLILAAFVLYLLAGILTRLNPLRGVVVPALPSLTVGTNNPAGGGHMTNPATLSAAAKGTNSARISAGSATAPSMTVANTNPASPPVPTATESNSIARDASAKAGTNPAPALAATSNAITLATAPGKAGTNVAHSAGLGAGGPDSMPMPGISAMNSNPFVRRASHADDLPPAVQARISRISESEILGPVMRPLPMGLLGIAGNIAFLRTASGQTGLVKEGDSLGDLKLVQIGINRVLIEQDGQKKELTIFSGYGGESLLPKQKEAPDDTSKQ